MKIKSLLAIIFIFSFIAQILAQDSTTENFTLKGNVIDNATNLPLAYVSIGVVEKPQGTVSDTTGHFLFYVSRQNLNDSLQISLVGYYSIRVSVKDYLANSDKPIHLTKKIDLLPEVVLTGHTARINTEIVGRQAVNKLVQVSVHNKKTADETIGSEMGMRYKSNRQNAILKDFNFYISGNNFDFIKFRINIYAVKEDMPDTLLYEKQILAVVGNFKTGWTKIDLEQYNIKVYNNFIVTIQWVESRMDKKESPITILPIAVTPFSKNCYARIASQDKWKRMGINMSSFVTIAF